MKRTEILLVGLIILFATVAGLSQTIVYATRVPQGAVFPFVHNFVNDYYYYLQLMRQGFEGHWGATTWMSPEIFEPRILNLLFLTLGHLGRIFSFGDMTLPIWYTVGRISGAMALLIGTYLMIYTVFPVSGRQRIAGLLCVVFNSFYWGLNNTGITVSRLVHEWTELDPLFRIAYIPHHLWSKVFMILSFVAIARIYKGTHSGVWIVLGVLSVLCMGFSSPVSIATAGIVYAGVLVWGAMRIGNMQKILHTHWMSSTVLFTLVALVVALYHRAVQQDVFPWTSYLAWETVKYPIGLWEYVLHFGPALPLALFSIPQIKKHGIGGTILFLWAVSGFIGLFVLARFLPLSNIRFLEGYQYIPISILAAVGIVQIQKWCSQLFPVASRYIFWMLVGGYVMYGVIGMRASWNEHMGYVRANSTNIQVYVPAHWMEALWFLEKQTPAQSVVIAPYEFSVLVPAFSGKRVIAAHPMMTNNEKEKAGDIARFYGHIPLAEKKDIIEKYSADWIVVYSPAAQKGDFEQLGFRQVFANESVIVYTRIGI